MQAPNFFSDCVMGEEGRIEEPRGKPRGIFDRKEFCLMLIRSLFAVQVPYAAAGLVLDIEIEI